VKNLNFFAKLVAFCVLVGSISCLTFSKDIHSSEGILEHLREPSYNCLLGAKIVLTVELPPNFDVPSTGAGDCLFYPRILIEYLKSLGAEEVVLDLGKKYGWLTKFFKECSNIKLVSDFSEQELKEYVGLEVREILDNVQKLEEFESRSRYFSNDPSLDEEIEKVVKKLEGMNSIVREEVGRNMTPVLFTRQSAHYDLEKKEDEKDEEFEERKELLGYLNHRSISIEGLEKFAEVKPDFVKIYNNQFEDQDKVDIKGIEKPDAICKVKANFPFGKDYVRYKAFLRAGGQIVSIDSSPLCVAIGIPEVNDTRKNIKALLAKNYNSRWKAPFVKDGVVCWSQNVELYIQEKYDDWTDVRNKVVKNWEDFGAPVKTVKKWPEIDCSNCIIL